jgi:hypothetical protein
MKLAIVFLSAVLCFLDPANASFGDFFGASPSTIGIGGQFNGNVHDPANNYYAPAILAFGERVGINANATSMKHDFEDIPSVILKNDTNHAYGSQSGPVRTDYSDYRASAVHLSIPLKPRLNGTFGLSFFSPLGDLIEVNTGSAFLPEYVMYRARYRRTSLHLNYAHQVNDSFSFSIGSLLGFQVGAEMNTQASLSGSSFGSSASAQAKVSPALGLIASLAKKHAHGTAYFTYNQEMKSNLSANVSGDTSDPPIPFDIMANSMSYYDPHVFRFGSTLNSFFGTSSLSLEYQMWENYETPVVRITQRISIRSSENREVVKTQNIFVPRIGHTFYLTDKFDFMLGASYRPTPLKGDFSGSGNSVDTNTLMLTGGANWRISLMKQIIELSAVGGLHQLEEKTIVKSPNQENGSAGTKIGGPQYKIGGQVYFASLGIRTEF